LISYGANVNKAAEDSLTALHIVTMNRDINCIKLILSASPVMSIRTIDGLTAYDIARMKGFDDIFSKLVQETVPYDQSYRIREQVFLMLHHYRHRRANRILH
jgi:ankyrin repeat protein